MAAIAGISIILAAVYTLNMIQKIFYGNTVALTESAHDSAASILMRIGDIGDRCVDFRRLSATNDPVDKRQYKHV